MNLAFASGTQQQRQWVLDAIGHTKLRVDALPEDVTVDFVADPPCPGHNDYMCSTEVGPSASISVRRTADSSSLATGATQGSLLGDELKKFYMESIIHEIGHLFQFTYVTSDPLKTTLASYFVHNETLGNAPRVGTLADFNPLGSPWEERIQEAVAETVKDLYMPDAYRHYDNRTNWNLAEEHLLDFIGMLHTWLTTEQDWVSAGYAGSFSGLHIIGGKYYGFINWAGSGGGSIPVPPDNRILNIPFRARTGRLNPATILADNGRADVTVYVPSGMTFIPDPDQTYASWVDTTIDLDMSISDGGGAIGSDSIHIDSTGDGERVYEASFNPGLRVPTTGTASLVGHFPDGYFKDVEGDFGTAGDFHGILQNFAWRVGPLLDTGIPADPSWGGLEIPEVSNVPGEWPYSDPIVGLAQGFQATFRHRKP